MSRHGQRRSSSWKRRTTKKKIARVKQTERALVSAFKRHMHAGQKWLTREVLTHPEVVRLTKKHRKALMME